MAGPPSGGRAMSYWLLDANHLVIPVVKRRLCLDYFIHNVAWLISLGSGLLAAVAYLLGSGSSPYYAVIGVLNAIMLVALWCGEWALADRLAPQSYTYLVCLWWAIVSLIWAGSALRPPEVQPAHSRATLPPARPPARPPAGQGVH
jgi:hypothetical protein